MLKGKTAVITGSGRGIGKSIALKLASHGANIGILYVFIVTVLFPVI